jgi:mannonate dehydratase
MQTAFRWYGHSDRVPLLWLRQMTPRPLVVTHLQHVPTGEVWPVEDLRTLRAELADAGLSVGPFESVFWTDDMKLGRGDRDLHIENYLKTLANLRAAFPDEEELIATYNLMPLDWGRTELAHLHPNGTRGLAYDHRAMSGIDLSHGLYLPGWSRRYSPAELTALRSAYAGLGVEGFWKNVRYVLAAAVPVAAEHGIRLAAHPNDPPWSFLGFPAFLCNATDIRRLLALYPHRANALCFCTGSYGADPANDILAMIREFKDSIAWMHLRAVKTTAEKTFHEADHADPTANFDLLAVVRTLIEIGWDGVVRSDHGLDLMYESDSVTNGYPAIDRYAANKMLWAYHRALKSVLRPAPAAPATSNN